MNFNKLTVNLVLLHSLVLNCFKFVGKITSLGSQISMEEGKKECK